MPNCEYRIEVFVRGDDLSLPPFFLDNDGKITKFIGSFNLTTDESGSAHFNVEIPYDLAPGDTISATARG
jgi:hypothetical protein